MKLILLHGAAITSSRVKLVEIKRKFDTNNVIVFENGSDIQSILASITTPSLLSQEQLIVLENPPEDFTPTTDYQLIFWFDHEISDKKPIMDWVKNQKGEVLYFPEAKEVSVFPFLDALTQGSRKAYLELDKLKKVGFEVFYFLTMVFYLLRTMVLPPKNAPTFVREKLKKQRLKFNEKDLERLYLGILEIEFKLKSGLLEKDQAEFLLINKFL